MLKINFYGLVLAVNLILISFVPVQAQSIINKATPNSQSSTPSANPSKKRIVFVKPRPGQGAPRGTKPAGSRSCLIAETLPFTPLLPVTKYVDNTQLVWSLTTQERPRFWFYVPFSASTTKEAKFSLRNQLGEVIYETPVKLNKTPGVISISLPDTKEPLEINKWYQSYLFISTSCPNSYKIEKKEASGWVKRQDITSEQKNLLDKTNSSLEKATFYAKNGFWNDAITILGEQRRNGLQNDEWKELLKLEGFYNIATEPILEEQP